MIESQSDAEKRWNAVLNAINLRIDNIQTRLDELVAELKNTHKQIMKETDRVLDVIGEAEEATEHLQKIAPTVEIDTLKLLIELFKSVEKWRNYEY